jgi:hypothetical protein
VQLELVDQSGSSAEVRGRALAGAPNSFEALLLSAHLDTCFHGRCCYQH